MTREEIQNVLQEFVWQQFPAARSQGLGVNDSLLTQGIIDSLGVLEIVGFIEERFAVVLSDDEMVADHFNSIAELAEFIEQKLRPETPCSS